MNIRIFLWVLMVVSSPVLAYPNYDLTYILYTDASLCGIGAVLSQVDKTGTEHVIAYGSKTLSKTQKNYFTAMREVLAAVIFNETDSPLSLG